MLNRSKSLSNAIADGILDRWENMLTGWIYRFKDFLPEDGCWIRWKLFMKEMDKSWQEVQYRLQRSVHPDSWQSEFHKKRELYLAATYVTLIDYIFRLIILNRRNRNSFIIRRWQFWDTEDILCFHIFVTITKKWKKWWTSW